MSRYFDWPASLKRFVRFDAARSEDVNGAFDELTAGMDTLDADVNRAIKLPAGTADQTLTMGAGQRAGLLLSFDASGNVTAVAGGGRYRGDWATATAYVVADYFRDPASKNIYSTVAAHTSGVLATDITAGRVQLAINVADVEAAKTAAEAAAVTAMTQAGLASASAGDANTSKLSAQAAQAAAEAVVATIPNGTINDATTSLTSVWSSSKTSSELGGKLNATSGTASSLTLNNGYTEQVFALTGTTPALDEANGSIQTWTLSGASTPTDSLASGQSLILGITAGANTVTWPSVTWSKVGGSGTAPSLTSTGVNWVILWKVGATLRGAFLGTA